MIYKTVLTIADERGIFAEVGMTNRTILTGSIIKCHQQAQKLDKNLQGYRLEFFNPERFYAADPLFTHYRRT